jgi:SpoVK/Ycf46/Vps4 family AAA+-type ATPase
MNKVEEQLLDNTEVINLIVNFLKNEKKKVKPKIDDLIKKIKKYDKLAANDIKEILLNSNFAYNNNNNLFRSTNDIVNSPTSDDNLDLVKQEDVFSLDTSTFIWQNNVEDLIETTYKEHQNIEKLEALGLEPIKSILFYGVPGVGKTIAAKVIAKKLNLPLCILDLSTIINSYLGKTGNNIRKVFDYAIKNNCVLLIDEFDAIAKQRTDESDVGELKRLVTVLLQAIDNWPSTSVLIAATNHPELLDRAIWRRFDQVIEFDLPQKQEVYNIISSEIKEKNCDIITRDIFIKSCLGLSHGLIRKEINKILKDTIINNKPMEQSLCENLARRLDSISKDDKLSLSYVLYSKGIMTQRKLAELLCISRDAIRKYKPVK